MAFKWSARIYIYACAFPRRRRFLDVSPRVGELAVCQEGVNKLSWLRLIGEGNYRGVVTFHRKKKEELYSESRSPTVGTAAQGARNASAEECGSRANCCRGAVLYAEGRESCGYARNTYNPQQ